MATGYNIDLRLKAIEALKNGSLQRNVAKRFKVSESTVARWWRKYRETGDVSAKQLPKIRKRKVDYDKVLEYVSNHSDKTLKEIGAVFKIAAQSVSSILHKNNYTFKKKVYFLSKGMKKKEKSLKKKSKK